MEDVNNVSSLLNKSAVRKKLIQHARDTRFYWMSLDNINVSKETMDKLEASVSAHIRSIVAALPSKGKTI